MAEDTRQQELELGPTARRQRNVEMGRKVPSANTRLFVCEEALALLMDTLLELDVVPEARKSELLARLAMVTRRPQERKVNG